MADGFIPLNKPAGISSHQAVMRVKRLMGEKKAGHTGTLDPEATGLLLIAVGRATRLTEYLLGEDKCYQARVRFGRATATGDQQGKTTDTLANFHLTAAELEIALDQFRGTISQIPPAASAIKVDGKRAYKLFRQGQNVQLPPRTVKIYSLRICQPVVAITPENPEILLAICCSKGTYIRGLARDLGVKTGIPAYLAWLQRISIGPVTIRQACSFEQLMQHPEDYLLDMSVAVRHLPHYELSDSQRASFCYGRAVKADAPSGTVAAFYQDVLVGIGNCSAGLLRPHKVLQCEGEREYGNSIRHRTE